MIRYSFSGDVMRLVRKVSRKKYLGKYVYESERFLLPIPSENRDLLKPLLGKDLEVSREGQSLAESFQKTHLY
jgi:hypothetical protein